MISISIHENWLKFAWSHHLYLIVKVFLLVPILFHLGRELSGQSLVQARRNEFSIGAASQG